MCAQHQDQITSGLAHRADDQGEADQHRHHQLGHGPAISAGLRQNPLVVSSSSDSAKGDVGHGQADGGDGSVVEQVFIFPRLNLINCALCA